MLSNKRARDHSWKHSRLFPIKSKVDVTVLHAKISQIFSDLIENIIFALERWVSNHYIFGRFLKILEIQWNARRMDLLKMRQSGAKCLNKF